MSIIRFEDHRLEQAVNGVIVTYWMVDNKQFEDVPSAVMYIIDTLECTEKEAREYLRSLKKVLSC